MNDICFRCADLFGKLRPRMDVYDCQFKYKNPKSDDDHKLVKDMDEALSLEVPEETDPVGHFLPGSSCDRSNSYAFVVYQDYGLVTESEFTRICKVTPTQAGLAGSSKKIPSLHFSFNGPSSRERYYLIGLEGLAVDQLFSIRKVRLQLTDSVSCLAVFGQVHFDLFFWDLICLTLLSLQSILEVSEL